MMEMIYFMPRIQIAMFVLVMEYVRQMASANVLKKQLENSAISNVMLVMEQFVQIMVVVFEMN